MIKSILYRQCLLTVLMTIGVLLSGLAQKTEQYDVCIYGGTSAGVIAAYTAKKYGKSVILIEPSRHLGGMTSGGLGYTDIGNKYAITGLSRDFYRRIGQHYGKFEQWTFEPGVAKKELQWYLDQVGIQTLFSYRIVTADKKQQAIQHITIENSENPSTQTNRIIRAKMFIDCTYEGDLMARAGISYFVGREANSDFNETINGVQLMTGHQMPNGIDPYITPGKPESGLLWGISPAQLQPNGSGDKLVQAYNYRICLTNDPKNLVPITEPSGYDPKKYELLVRLMEKQPQRQTLNDYFIWSRMPNNKTDINNRNGFSTDAIGLNHRYPEADYAERARIIAEHEAYTKGLLYFVGNDPRVPQKLRDEMKKWGYPKDEYTDAGNWSPQLYIREARRLKGHYIMTQANCEGKEVVKDGVGMAAYTMDSHNTQRIVVNGMVKNEGNVEIGGFGPYPISYGSIIPKAGECTNLLVPVCLSATHIAYGSIRMEPVFMVLAQSAALAASKAIDTKSSVQNVNVRQLQEELTRNPLANNATAEILVDNENAGNIEKTGEWDLLKRGAYGPTSLISEGASSGSVRFKPQVTKAGAYEVFIYFPKVQGISHEIAVNVFDGKKTTPLVIKEKDIVVEGQTSGEWYSVGKYQVPVGKSAYVEITTNGATGKVPADAVLWVPRTK